MSILNKVKRLYIVSGNTLNGEKQWNDKFSGPNSCGVATEFCGKNYFDLNDQKSDENGPIL